MTATFYIDNEWFVGSGRLATPDLSIGNCTTQWFAQSKLDFFTLDTEKMKFSEICTHLGAKRIFIKK